MDESSDMSDLNANDFIGRIVGTLPVSVILDEISSKDRILRAVSYFQDHSLETLTKTELDGNKRPKKDSLPASARLLTMFFKEKMFPRKGDSRSRKYMLRPTGGDYRYSADDDLNNLPGGLKSWIFHESVELDVVNCYPTLACVFIDLHCDETSRVSMEAISDFVENRPVYLQALEKWSVENMVTMSTSEAKKFYSTFWGGASLTARLELMSVEFGHPGLTVDSMPEIVVSLWKAWQSFRSFVCEIFPHRRSHHVSLWESCNKLLSRLFSSMESSQMLLIRLALSEIGIQVTNWTYDGMYVKRGDFAVDGNDQTNEFLATLRSRLVGSPMFYKKIHLSFKAHDQTEWTDRCPDVPLVEVEQPEDESESLEMDLNENSSMSLPLSHRYVDMKRAFENRLPGGACAFKMSSGDYQHAPMRDGVPVSISLTNLKNEYSPWTNHCEDLPDNKQSFVENWNSDPTRKTYARIVSTTNAKPNEFNLWKGTWIERNDPFTSDDRENRELMEEKHAGVRRIRDRLFRLLDDSRPTENREGNGVRLFSVYWKMLAHLFQYPCSKPPEVYYCMRTVGMTGKGLFWNMGVRGMIDNHDNSLSTVITLDQIGLMSGSNVKFNSTLQGKLLFVHDEVVVPQELNESLKAFLSATTHKIRAMRENCIDVPNHGRHVNLNNKDPLTVPIDDRRTQYSRSTNPALTADEIASAVKDYSDPQILRLWWEDLMREEIAEDFNFSTAIVYTEDYVDLAEKSSDPVEYFFEQFLSSKLSTRQLVLPEKDLWTAYTEHLAETERPDSKTGLRTLKALTQAIKDRFDVSINSGSPKRVDVLVRYNNSSPVGRIDLDYSDLLRSVQSGMLINTHRISHADNCNRKVWVISPERALEFVRSIHAKRVQKNSFSDLISSSIS